MKTIVWLASYPKSGNTWLRIFLCNYLLNDTDEPLPINKIGQLGINDNFAEMYRKAAGGKLAINDHLGALKLRPQVLAAIARNGAQVNLMKTHSGNFVIKGQPLMPAPLSRAAIHVIRNPLDVCVSYARHFGLTPNRAAVSICRDDNSTSGSKDQLKQFLGSWIAHTHSWTRAKDFPVITLRYEDMLADPAAAFDRALRHLGVTPDQERLERSVRFSQFDELQRQEAQTAFVERSDNAERFFHTGRSDQWRETLSEVEVSMIHAKNAEAMKEFGYL